MRHVRPSHFSLECCEKDFKYQDQLFKSHSLAFGSELLPFSRSMMKLKELQSLMQDIDAFVQPVLELEQYPTGVEIAARMLYTIDSVYHDFEGKVVADLGCGTGRLSIGAALLGSPHVIGIDVDDAALDTCRSNAEQFDDLPEGTCMQMDLLRCDVVQSGNLPRLKADTVIMNPPFGTRRKGADLSFLRAGLKISTGSVYSLHKTSTRQHIQRLIENEAGVASCEVLAQLRYNLLASFSFHRQKSKDIEVDLWRFSTNSPL